MRCVVPNCDSNPSKTSREMTYHIFPTEPSLRAAWLQALHMADWALDERSAVCSSHFQREDLLESSGGLRAGAVPAGDVQVCKICFATQCKLYSMKTCRVLSEAYETLTDLLLENEDNLPPYLCSECARRLLDITRFRATSLQAHLVLLGVVNNYGFITLELIQSAARNQSGFKLNRTDCGDEIIHDIERELIEKKHTRAFKDEGVQTVRENIVINKIKTENNVIKQELLNTEDTINDNVPNYLNFSKNITKGDIKIESEEATLKQSNYHAIDTNNIDSEYVEMKDVFDEGNCYTDDIGTFNIITFNDKVNDIIANQFDGNVEVTTDNDIDIENEDVASPTVCNIEVVDESTLIIEESYELEVEERSGSPSAAGIKHNPCIDDGVSPAEARRAARPSAAVQATKVPHDAGLSLDKLSCHLCPYQTGKEHHLMSHLKSHASNMKYSCNMCSYITTFRNNFKKHVKLHSGVKQFACDVCSESFATKQNCAEHMRRHTGKKPFSCSICNMPFYDKPSLDRHTIVHSNERPFLCSLCNTCFKSKRNVMRHMRSHSSETSFTCKLCNKAFKCKKSLTRHTQTHKVAKPFSCVNYNKAFTDKHSLKSHISLHEGKKPFSCDICKKAFDTKQYLTIHMRAHTGEKLLSCDMCDEAYPGIRNLKRHIMSVHSGKKLFSCDVCNKSFSSKYYHKEHIKIHTGENPFLCEVCNKSFANRYTRKTHIMKTHADT